MRKSSLQEPWERPAALVAARDSVGVRRFLKIFPGGEIARALPRVAGKATVSLMDLLGPAESAELLGNLSDAQAVKVLEELEPDQAAAIIEELPSAERANLPRELALGLLKPYEYARVILKEGAVGMINGLVLGVLLGLVAAFWQGNVFLGLVVGSALMLNTIIAVLLEGLIPLGLRSLRQDPALASGPILTTVTDMMGFLMVLSFASMVLSRLA